MVVAPNGKIHAQSRLRQEELVVADIDVDQATRAMFLYDLEASTELLFGDTVSREEFIAALEPNRTGG